MASDLFRMYDDRKVVVLRSVTWGVNYPQPAELSVGHLDQITCKPNGERVGIARPTWPGGPPERVS
jgi:hypothetical protein